MLKAYKYRIYPTQSQAIKINRNIGCVRYIYNWALALKIKEWNENKNSLSQYDLCYRLPQLKQEPDKQWLAKAVAQSLQCALDDLDKAYTNFFRDKKGFPKFKRKHGSKQSFRIPQKIKIDWECNKLYFPKYKDGIKFIASRTFEGTIKNITISKTPSNQYYASILTETNDQIILPNPILESTTIGIDLGITNFITLSTGEKIENKKIYKKYEHKLTIFSKRYNRKQKGSNNQEKSRIKLAKVHQKIVNSRKDFLHKLTYTLTHETQVHTIVLEDLAIENMLKFSNLAKSIADCSWGKFIELLKYKSSWYGINLLKIGRFEPSSKLCNSCGVIFRNLKLKDRTWTCKCGIIHDRDTNAAINIKKIGLHNQNRIGWDSPESTLGEKQRRQALC